MRADRTDGIEVLSDASNCPVLRMHSRKYPGILIQGDSLKSLHSLAEDLVGALSRGELEEAADLAEQLEDDLRSRLSIYEAVLTTKGVQLPYPRRS